MTYCIEVTEQEWHDIELRQTRARGTWERV